MPDLDNCFSFFLSCVVLCFVFFLFASPPPRGGVELGGW